MRMVRAFAPKRSQLVEAHGIDVGKTQFYKQPEGTLEVITSSATAAEGAECSLVVGDETENWRPSNGGTELSAVLLDNLASRIEELPAPVRARVVGLAEYMLARTELEMLRFRALAGEDVTGAEFAEVVERPRTAGAVYRLPKNRELPTFGDRE